MKDYLANESGSEQGDFPAGFYEDSQDSFYNGYNESFDRSGKEEDKTKYGDYIPVAQKFQNKCEYVYSLFMEAYKEIIISPVNSKQQTKLLNKFKDQKGLTNEEVLELLTKCAREGMMISAQQQMIQSAEAEQGDKQVDEIGEETKD